jgi:hypothetical protein
MANLTSPVAALAITAITAMIDTATPTAATAGTATPAKIHCPAVIDAKAVYDHIEVLNGVPGDEATEAPAWLVPDEKSLGAGVYHQSWEITAAPDEPFTVVCYYHDTKAVRAIRLPDAITRCEQTFKMKKDGNIAVSGPPKPSMLCK